jgi:photosystem II stability/assembly factor-like uncharacterized protein
MFPKLALILLAALVLFADSASVAQNFWEPANGAPVGKIEAIAMSASGVIFVGTEYSDFGGGIFRSTDKGITWVECDSGFPGLNEAYSIAGLVVSPHSGSIFAGAGEYVLFRSTDSGNSWKVCLYPLGTLRAFTVDSAGIILAGDWRSGYYNGGTDTGGIYRSTDDGLTWTWVPILENSSVSGFCNYSNGAILAGSSQGGVNGELVLFSSDGLNASPFGALPDGAGISSVACSSADTIYAGTPDSGVFRSIDSGHNWTAINYGLTDTHINTLNTYGNGEIILGTRDEGIFRSSDGGNTWETSNSVFPTVQDYSVNAIAVDKQGQILAGTDGGIFVSSDSGRNWDIKTDGLFGTWIYSLASTSDGSLFAMTDRGLIRSIDNGQTWGAISAGSGIYASGISCSGGFIFVQSDSERFFRSSDGGNTWEAINKGLPLGSLNSSTRFLGLNTDPCGHLFIWSDSGMFVSTNSGDSWEHVTTGVPYDAFNSYTSDANCNIFAGGNRVYRSTDDGQSWMVVDNGIKDTLGVLGITIDNKGILYAGVYQGGIFRSTDGGGSWQQLDSSLRNVTYWSLISDKNGNIFASGPEIGVLLSTDQGNHWESINSGLTVTDVRTLVETTDGNLFVGTPEFGVFHSALASLEVRSASYTPIIFLTLSQNSPNPVTQSTIISFTLPEPSYITLTLYDATGREVAALMNGFMDAGEHDVPFQRGNTPSGVYFYRLESGGQSQTQAMVILP